VIQHESHPSDSSTRIEELHAGGASLEGVGARSEDGGLSASVLDAALDYHRRGFAPLPLRGKQPATDLIRKTHGTGRTTTLAGRGADEEQVRFWFADPAVNVGVFCGEPSGGLVVVDVDDPALLAEATLPLTPTVTTGRGYHLYYRTDVPVGNERHEWGEIRAQAPLYVVAPASVHDSGVRYRWRRGLGDLALADFTHVRLPERTKNARSDHSQQQDQIRPTKAVLLGPCPTRDQAGEGWLRSFDRDPRAVEAMARALGIEAPLGKPFRYILQDERNA